jgi:signal transduction histidine kinase/CheY-like chemotaxis protein
LKNWLAPLLLAVAVTIVAGGALWVVNHFSGWPVYAACFFLLLTIFLSVWKWRTEVLVQRKMTRDAPDKKQAEESSRCADRMRLARDRAEDAGRAKNAFLAMMSHEIRTPMHAVMGHLDLLLSGSLEEAVRGHVESAQTGARSMLALLEDLLAVARIDQEDVQIEEKEFEISEWVRGLTGLFRRQVEAKGLEWRLHLAENLPTTICSDRVRLSQCLFALLENAVKFTVAGYVELRVAWQEGMLSRRLRLEVRDSGPGIPPQDLEKIFEPFARTDESQSCTHGGLGVSLAICHNLTTRLGGTLTATSQPGQGSTFVLEIPLHTSAPPSPPRAPAAPAEYPCLDLHILIVEDQKTNQKLLGMMLKKIGCTCEFADNGLEGVRKFQEKTFDAIFMDLQMPEMDGIAAARTIRAMEAEKAARSPVPIIAVTANTFSTDRAECLAVGMNDFLGKPVRVKDLASSLLATSTRPPQAN